MNVKDSETIGTLAVRVECMGGIDFRIRNGCRLGCHDCAMCLYLMFLDRGEVVPFPEEDEKIGVK